MTSDSVVSKLEVRQLLKLVTSTIVSIQTKLEDIFASRLSQAEASGPTMQKPIYVIAQRFMNAVELQSRRIDARAS